MSSEAQPLQHLVDPPRRPSSGFRRRFLLFVLLTLLLHLALFAALTLLDFFFAPKIQPTIEETPVEVIVEPPPPPPPPQPKEEPKKEEPQKQEEQKKPPPPPKQQYIEEEPAHDAPKEQSKEKVERESPDEKAQAQKQAPPKDAPAPEQTPETKDNKPLESAPDVSEEKAEKKMEDKPDAEVIERAEEKKPPTQEEKKTTSKNKGEARKGEAKSIAEQLASLQQLPDFKFGGAAKPSPVGGGNAKTTYLTILYGLIMPHMHVPERVRGGHLPGRGIVAFYIDEMGNLTHQAVYQTSGLPDLDAAAIAAVRRAAPFPPPPRGLPHAIQFSYSTR